MNYKITKRDVVSIIILLSGFLMLFILFQLNSPGAVAHVEYNGNRIMELSLSGEQSEIAMPHNENIIISYGSDGVCFISSDCPDKVCIAAGYLSLNGEVAACLPNNTVVSVEGEGADIVI